MHGSVIAERFRLTAPLGEGATGEVWRADDLCGGAAAVKLLRGELTYDAGTARRFARESRTLQRLSHQHLPVILDAGEDALTGRCFIALAYVEAETLRAVIQREAPMTWDAAAAIMLPVMSALSAAHAAGVIHRDVKPENVLVQWDGPAPRPLLIDFGLCKHINGGGSLQTRSGVLLGTPAYMAPEQAAGERDVDVRADVWAAGAVWFELLTGTTPFVDALPGRLLARVISDEPPSLAESRPDLPRARCEAIDRAIARDRARRFESVDAFASALLASPTRRGRRPSALAHAALVATLLPAHTPPSPPPTWELRARPSPIATPPLPAASPVAEPPAPLAEPPRAPRRPVHPVRIRPYHVL